MIRSKLPEIPRDRKRKISSKRFLMILSSYADKIRQVRPEATFGSDFICGFPTETEEQFLNTVKLVKEAGITKLHVFPYSERAGTPAALMPQVPVEERRRRANILRQEGEEING